ncbi:glycosyltransferase family 4 protein [Gordonia rhizosphera]|uniref:Putative glycosyltransferase n=1 Tax=Gordonia rhizosphera NBRC 16068 TaxID=1108045 RepID=K6VQA0_9ACTN|nr:glycosyltransferase family 4 protein [Gordonia rhizosphera]GAB89095.1 putative glycosyltransferase [Gordonia rhizosphera NBRC 16068]
MRVLVYPHDLNIGGSQLNAIEIAAGVRNLGHEVAIFGRRGQLMSRIQELGLEFIEAPPLGRRPSPATAKALADLVRTRQVDLIHGYEWPPTLDAVLARFQGSRAAVVSTVMSMSVPPFIPHNVDLVVGTEQIADAERAAGRRRVSVVEPPVDLSHNDISGHLDMAGFRSGFGLDDERILVVSVARFARELKLEGTLTAIDVIAELSESVPIRLVLVGDGPARADVERAARRANERHGVGTVVLTGELTDPRAAYAAADIMLGMGGSALRALAYGKPLIVQGEQGFWRTLRADTVDQFLWTGWYGIGPGPEVGAAALQSELSVLVDHGRRKEAGEFGLRLVRERFSLVQAARRQEDIYRLAVEAGARRRLTAEGLAFGRYVQYYGAKRLRRALGRQATDDFNSRPVAARWNAGS